MGRAKTDTAAIAQEVATVADDIGTLFAAMFDGRTPFPEEVPDSEQAS